MKCCYPNCYLEDEHEGDHRFGRPEKPWGALRLLQEFKFAHIRCETCEPYLGIPRHAATAFYADMLGFGWALCNECARQFTSVDPQPQPQPVAARKLAVPRVHRKPRAATPVAEIPAPAQKAKVLEFRKAGC